MPFTSPPPSAPDSNPIDLKRFLSHLIRESAQSPEDRIKALEELLLVIQQGAFDEGRRAERRLGSAVIPDRPTPLPSLEALWFELLKSGKGLPPGLGKLSGLVAQLGAPRALAMFFSIVERNALEGFHQAYLSNAQMKELNPIIRNAAFTALYALLTMDRSDHSRRYVDYQSQHIPPYWEQPELLDGFLQSLKDRGEAADQSWA